MKASHTFLMLVDKTTRLYRFLWYQMVNFQGFSLIKNQQKSGVELFFFFPSNKCTNWTLWCTKATKTGPHMFSLELKRFVFSSGSQQISWNRHFLLWTPGKFKECADNVKLCLSCLITLITYFKVSNNMSLGDLGEITEALYDVPNVYSREKTT